MRCILVWMQRHHYTSSSLFLQKTKPQSHPLQSCHLAVLCCTRCSTLYHATRQARQGITYVQDDTPRPDGPILIILGMTYLIVVAYMYLKLLLICTLRVLLSQYFLSMYIWFYSCLIT